MRSGRLLTLLLLLQARGRMSATRLAREAPNSFELVATSSEGDDVARAVEAGAGGGVVIDFSAPAATRAIAAAAPSAGVAIVSGTTGLDADTLAALEGASTRLVGAEALTEGELEILRRHYERLSKMAESDASLTMSHSVEEAERRHERKSRSGGQRR